MVRTKNRYFVLELLPPSESQQRRVEISDDAVHRAVVEAVAQIHGDWGVAAVRNRLMVKYANAVTRVVLLRVSHAAHRLLATALPFVTSLDEQPITARTLYVGATIMHCYKFLKRHQERRLEQLWQGLDQTQRRAMRQTIMTLHMPNITETRALPAPVS